MPKEISMKSLNFPYVAFAMPDCSVRNGGFSALAVLANYHRAIWATAMSWFS